MTADEPCDECSGTEDIEFVGGAFWCAPCRARFDEMFPVSAMSTVEEFGAYSGSFSTELVPTGVIIVCCASHRPGPIGYCCDREDCGPCCSLCPTCPTCAASEKLQPGWRKRSQHADAAFWKPTLLRWAHENLADALWWFDRLNPLRTVVHPSGQLLVTSYRRVQLTREEPF